MTWRREMLNEIKEYANVGSNTWIKSMYVKANDKNSNLVLILEDRNHNTYSKTIDIEMFVTEFLAKESF